MKKLTSLGRETEWVEFKENRAEPDQIGEYLSALSNAAALHGQDAAFIVWGVADETREIVGTSFRPRLTKKGQEELEPYLTRKLVPHINFKIHEGEVDGRPMVVFEVPPASTQPVAFDHVEPVRVGSYTKKLREFPEKERELWALFSRFSFEKAAARAGLAGDDVLEMLDHQSYDALIRQAAPAEPDAVLDRLVSERLVLREHSGLFTITNLGAVLFARSLELFQDLVRKQVRVIVYQGTSRAVTEREMAGRRGYAAGFQGLIQFISDRVPTNEQIQQALRREVPVYPPVAVRELVANALIHQDFTIRGTGPMVEIFADRIEVTNPGRPLIETARFIDAPPQSRNDALAALMRRLGICEERGSGIDKVISFVEFYQLPPPDFEVSAQHTKAVLFAPRKLGDMTKPEKLRACYQHACLQHVSNRPMTNATLRKRFGISDKNYSLASRIIADADRNGLVKRFDPTSRSKRDARYVPYWA